MPDTHGQAALLLCEALIHVLVEQKLLNVGEVCTAIEGIEEIAGEMLDKRSSGRTDQSALTLLSAIRHSLLAK